MYTALLCIQQFRTTTIHLLHNNILHSNLHFFSKTPDSEAAAIFVYIILLHNSTHFYTVTFLHIIMNYNTSYRNSFATCDILMFLSCDLVLFSAFSVAHFFFSLDEEIFIYYFSF